MTNIISGLGLGNFQTPSQQDFGSLKLGSNLQDQIQVNVTNGNLSLGRRDALMLGRLSHHQHLRTYNSLGLDDSQSPFIWGFDQRIILVSGSAHGQGSEVIRVSPDGFEQHFVYADGRYRSTDGSGAHDRLRFDAASQQWLYAQDFAKDISLDSGERVWVYNKDGLLVEERFRGEVVKSYYYDDGSSRYDESKNLNKVFYRLNVDIDNGFKKTQSYTVTFACHMAADTNKLMYHNYYNFEKS